jgi:hypothetical protein
MQLTESSKPKETTHDEAAASRQAISRSCRMGVQHDDTAVMEIESITERRGMNP